MATWHQRQAQRRGIRITPHATQWTVVYDPPGEMTTAMSFTEREAAERYRGSGPHAWIIPPAGVEVSS